MTKKIAFIIFMLSLTITGSVFGQFDIIGFKLGPPVDLETIDPTVPVTWQATIVNTSDLWNATAITFGFEFLDPIPGLGTVMFASGLPTFLMHGQSWQGNFASFDFYDWVPFASSQKIEFSISGNVQTKGKPFDSKYQIGSATYVPEPSSFLLLGAGLFGLVGVRVVRKRKK